MHDQKVVDLIMNMQNVGGEFTDKFGAVIEEMIFAEIESSVNFSVKNEKKVILL